MWTLVVFGLLWPASRSVYTPPMVVVGFTSEELCHRAAEQMRPKFDFYQGRYKSPFEIVYECVPQGENAGNPKSSG